MVTDVIVVPSLKGKKVERKKGVAGREEAAAGAGFGAAAGRRRRRPGMAGEVWRVVVESPSGRSVYFFKVYSHMHHYSKIR